MPDERSCGCGHHHIGAFDGLFGNDNITVLIFIVIFLLLFTDFGCAGR